MMGEVLTYDAYGLRLSHGGVACCQGAKLTKRGGHEKSLLREESSEFISTRDESDMQLSTLAIKGL